MVVDTAEMLNSKFRIQTSGGLQIPLHSTCCCLDFIFTTAFICNMFKFLMSVVVSLAELQTMASVSLRPGGGHSLRPGGGRGFGMGTMGRMQHESLFEVGQRRELHKMSWQKRHGSIAGSPIWFAGSREAVIGFRFSVTVIRCWSLDTGHWSSVLSSNECRL